MNSLTIPTTDLTEYLLLPGEVRQEIDAWLRELNQVTKPIQRSLMAAAARMGVSIQTARAKYDKWRRGHDWRVLINRSKIPQDRNLDPEFIEYWKALCEQYGRKYLPAHREFVRRFKSGEPIDGLPAGISRRKLPLGYSYDNLIRYRPSDLERAATQRGRSAAADHRPKLFTTRNGLRVGQYFIFDDMWHDFKVCHVGQRHAMRLLQLHAHDLFSACQFARGLKPRMEDMESGKSVGLKEDEMLFLLAHVLSEFGFHRDGCKMLVEHGTAAIRDDLERLLFDISGGKVTVERSGMEGASVFAGQYAGRGKGNFRFKASLESLGNLIHNETANLLQFPGQTGSNARLNAPEELAGREKHADALLLAMAALPAHVVAQLRLPFLEVNNAKWLVDEIMERINQRTQHELEGWLEAGLTTMDFDIPNVGIIPASHYLSLSPAQRSAVDAVASPAPRKLSPREVFEAGRKDLIKFRPEQTASLLKDRHGREVFVGKDHLVTLEDQTISPEPLRFLAHHFAAGDKFTAVINPWSPETLHLFDARNRWVGVIDAWQRVRKDDTEALHRQMGAAAKVEKELLAPIAARGAAITRKRIEDAQHNGGVLKSDRDAAEQIARRIDAL